MKMDRIFSPVGQGCFSIEKFSKKTVVVFDCGTLTRIGNQTRADFINQRIKEEIHYDEIIRYVFISHLDIDHVNGLAYLLWNYTVNEVVLPLLYDESKELYLGKNALSDSEEFNRLRFLIEQPVEFVQEYSRYHHTKTTFVAPVGEYGIEQKWDMSICYSGKEFYINKWVFVPFNFQYRENMLKLKKNLLDMGVNLDEIKDRSVDILKDSDLVNRIKKAYKKIDNDLNQNAMTVYSGPKEYSHYQTKMLTYGIPIVCGRNATKELTRAGCLYTGDYNASTNERWDNLKCSYRTYWDNIGLLQVPHHGSESCFNDQMGYEDCLLIINAGTKNDYHHPNPSVLYSLYKTNNTVFWVSEEEFGAMQFKIIRRKSKVAKRT